MFEMTNVFNEVNTESKKTTKYYMLNKDQVICEFNLISIGSGMLAEEMVEVTHIYNSSVFNRAVFGIVLIEKVDTSSIGNYKDKIFYEFLCSRRAPSNRMFIEGLLNKVGKSIDQYLSVTLGLSLTDTFWFKQSDNPVTWLEVSLYYNEFSKIISHYAFTGMGLYDMQVRTPSPEFSTDGALPKCWIKTDDIYLVKGGTEGYANAGREPYMEYLAFKVAEAMELNAVAYDVMRFKGRVVSKCKLFTSEELGYTSLARAMIRGISPMSTDWTVKGVFDLYKRLGFLTDLCEMIVFDGIICNTDRHFGNFGFLVDNDTLDIVRPAPIFDNGMSFGKNYISRVDGGLDGYIKKAVEPGPAILGNVVGFISAAREVLFNIDKAKVRRLLDFEFDVDLPGLTEPSIEFISKLVQHQAREILR